MTSCSGCMGVWVLHEWADVVSYCASTQTACHNGDMWRPSYNKENTIQWGHVKALLQHRKHISVETCKGSPTTKKIQFSGDMWRQSYNIVETSEAPSGTKKNKSCDVYLPRRLFSDFCIPVCYFKTYGLAESRKFLHFMIAKSACFRGETLIFS